MIKLRHGKGGWLRTNHLGGLYPRACPLILPASTRGIVVGWTRCFGVEGYGVTHGEGGDG